VFLWRSLRSWDHGGIEIARGKLFDNRGGSDEWADHRQSVAKGVAIFDGVPFMGLAQMKVGYGWVAT
jgi:hypothetical protein